MMFHKIYRFAFSVGLIASNAFAQVAPGSSLPEALKDIPQATGVCLRDKVTQESTATSAVRTAPDLSCAIAPTDLSILLGRPETALIDVRIPSEYSMFRIDGTLNVTVPQLRTKTFLQNKTVVLIGDGKAERELYVACAALKGLGFKTVKVLRGGLASWIDSGQSVVGRAPIDQMQAPRLSPSELIIESQFDENLLLIERSQAEIQKHLSFSVLLEEMTPAAVQTIIERRRRELKNAPLAAVVLVAPPNAGPEIFQRLRRAIQPVPLLVYADTLQALVKQQTQQKAIWAAQANGPKQPGCGL